jgi:YD repeat-containing protein
VIGGSRGNLTRVIAPQADDFLPPSSTTARRATTLFKYDAKDNLIQAVPPEGVATGATVTCATDLSGAITSSFVADRAYDVATQTKLESITRRFTDPDLGLKTAITKFEYTDAANPGRLTRIIPPRGNDGVANPADHDTLLAYYTSGAQEGMLQSVADALGNTTSYTYDAVGRRLTRVDANGNAGGATPAHHTWSFTYDAEDGLLTATAPAPRWAAGGGTPTGRELLPLVTEFHYDPIGNRTWMKAPQEYDAVANAWKRQVTTYAYDVREGLAEVKQSTQEWTNPAAPPSSTIATAFAYDDFGALKRVTRDQGGPQARVIDYQKDGLGR